MKNQVKTKEQLIIELQELQQENNSLKTSHQIDIAELKWTAALISENARNLEDAQKLAKIGSWKSDLTTNTVEWSAELYRINGYNPKLPVPSFSEMSRFYTPESWDRLNVAVTNAFNKGEPYELDLEQVRTDGNVFHSTVRGVPDFDDSGKMIGLHGTVQDINERKLAEDRLKESEAKFRNVVEEVVDVVLAVDLEGNFTYVNPAGEKLSGYSVEELTKMKYFDLIDPEYQQLVKRNFVKQYLERNAFTFSEYPIRSKSGEIIWINQNTRLIIENNEAKGFFAISREVSELHKAETALKESEEKYRLIVENIGEGFGFVNAEEQFLLANKSAELIFGVGPNGLVGKDLDQFVSKEGFRKIQEETTRRKEGIQSVYELDIVRPNGELRTIHVTAVPQKHKDGSFNGTYGIFHDITERKLTEATIFNERLLLRTLIDNIPDSIYSKDLACRKTLANFTELQFMGVKSESEVLGKDDFAFYPKELADKFFTDDQSVIQSGNPVLNREEYILDENGQKRWLLTSKLPLHDKYGRIIGLVGIGRDVTERKQVEAEIILKNEELSRVISERDKFFSIIAHDLRGPFNGFLGLTQIMMEELDTLSREDLLRMAQGMEKSASNLFSLLENLLHWARMQQGLIPFNPIGVQLLTVVESCCSILFEQAKIKGVDITVDISADLSVFADTNMLQTIIRNLVSNALKFTHKGGKVAISANTGDNNNVVVAIKDTGIGMSSEMVDNLFRLDVQTGRPGTNGESSSGLGLVLCKEFVEKHGYKIMVKSEEGKGSTFCFTLPGIARSK